MDDQQFSDVLKHAPFAAVLDGASDIAVAVSGGPDSMALALMLDDWAAARGIRVHALSVDHGLRAESAAEAAQVGVWLADCAATEHHILTWHGDKPEVSLQEEARRARYDLMNGYCAEHGINALFLAQHMDDQAETVLFRLAKGSGLTGLCGMRAVSQINDINILRPFLDVEKANLIAYLEARGQKFVQDPSNADEAFARVRLRKSADVLAEEGLTAKRLSVTAARLGRAEEALSHYADGAFKDCAQQCDSGQIVLKYAQWQALPEEIALRVLIACVSKMRDGQDYLPRMERLEALFVDLRGDAVFRKRTLGGLVFMRDDDKKEILILPEE